MSPTPTMLRGPADGQLAKPGLPRAGSWIMRFEKAVLPGPMTAAEWTLTIWTP